jgi:hypothetical protein
VSRPFVDCGRCGRHARGRLASATEAAVCVNCLAFDRKPKTPCRGCGRVVVIRARLDGLPTDLCDACRPTREQRVCGGCGRVGRLAVRATDTTPALGRCCYRPPVATCDQCGRQQPCYHASDPEKAICLGCASRRTRIVSCLECGKPRAPHRRVQDGAICQTCDRKRGNTTGICAGCGGRAPLARDLCDPCRLRDTIEALARDGDPDAVQMLAPFLAELAAAPNPASTLRWMQTPTFWVTKDLIAGRIEVSHAGLDDVAPRAPAAVAFVRAKLVASGVLPVRDEPSAAFARWHARAVERIAPGRDRAHVRAYATWNVAHQLARTSSRDRPTTASEKYARSLVSEAIKLVCWLHAQQLELCDLRQDLLDTWIADGAATRRRVRLFIAWLQRGEILGARLNVAWDYRYPGRPPLIDEQRLAILRRLLEDRSIDPRDRFAGSVLLLYAQPLTRIARLRTTDITMTEDGQTTIAIGRGHLSLPEPLASIALGLRYQQLQHTGHEGWLLPGRHAGTPVSADNLRLRLKRYDIASRPARHGALLALAARLPAPILADRLGIDQSRAAQWVQAAGATYAPYVQLRSNPARHG